MKNKESFAITGLVLGLVSFIPLLQFIAVPGIIFSALGMKSEKRGIAVAGLVLSIVVLVLTVMSVVLLGSVWVAVSNFAKSAAVVNITNASA